MTKQADDRESSEGGAARRLIRRTRGRVAFLLTGSCDAFVRLRTGQAPRPTDAPRGHAPGPDIHRLLILGAGPATGWGVTTHELALPGALARAVSARTERGCTVDLVTHVGMTVATALPAAEGRGLGMYDAIVLTLGVNDALMLTSPSTWERQMSRLLDALVAATPTETVILVASIQPIRTIPIFDTPLHNRAHRRSRLLNEMTASLCTVTERATFVALPAPEHVHGSGDRYGTPLHYQFWAKCLALPLEALLATHPPVPDRRRATIARPTPEAELARQEAVAQLDFSSAAADTQLKRIIALAQRAFNAETALFTIIDEDRQVSLTEAGRALPDVARIHSFCDFVIKGHEVMIVRDTLEDERFRDSPLVTGERQVRFYAGFPIESPSGERIGALCILDSHPRRRADDIDVTLLRELGHLVQRELERHLPAAAARRRYSAPLFKPSREAQVHARPTSPRWAPAHPESPTSNEHSSGGTRTALNGER